MSGSLICQLLIHYLPLPFSHKYLFSLLSVACYQIKRISDYNWIALRLFPIMLIVQICKNLLEPWRWKRKRFWPSLPFMCSGLFPETAQKHRERAISECHCLYELKQNCSDKMFDFHKKMRKRVTWGGSGWVSWPPHASRRWPWCEVTLIKWDSCRLQRADLGCFPFGSFFFFFF